MSATAYSKPLKQQASDRIPTVGRVPVQLASAYFVIASVWEYTVEEGFDQLQKRPWQYWGK